MTDEEISTDPVPGETYTFEPVATAYLSFGMNRSLARLIDLALETNAPTIMSGSERVGLRQFAKACLAAVKDPGE